MNTTTTENSLTFASAEAKAMPTLICVGTVEEVGNAKVSSSEKYIVQPIKIAGLDAGRSQTVYFLYRPEWLVAGFSPRKLKEQDASAHFVYSKNIAGEDDLSVLHGLAGSEKKFEALAHELLSLPVDTEIGGPTMESVEATLRTFFANNVGPDGNAQKIGYILQQDSEKTGEVNPDTGKAVYIKKKGYKLDIFFEVTVKNLKAKAAYAAKSEGRQKFCYSTEGVPF